MQQEVCAVQRELLEQLREITEEERRILNGDAEVDRDLYTSGSDFTIDSNKMLEDPHPYQVCSFSTSSP